MTFIDLYTIGGEEGREDLQIYWQNFIAKKISFATILDVGSGMGHSKERLSINNNTVYTQEPAPNLEADFKKDISQFDDNSYDYVTCFDVLEHIQEDVTFLKHLFRVCKYGTFISTPNYLKSFNGNPYHVREYTPTQLVDLCHIVSNNVKYFSDCGSGVEIQFYRSHLRPEPFTINTIIELTENDFLNLKDNGPHLGVMILK